jgi:hypothetical protein
MTWFLLILLLGIVRLNIIFFFDYSNNRFQFVVESTINFCLVKLGEILSSNNIPRVSVSIRTPLKSVVVNLFSYIVAKYRTKRYLLNYGRECRPMLQHMTRVGNEENLQHLLMSLRNLLTQRHLHHNSLEKLMIARDIGCLIEIPRCRFTPLQIIHAYYIFILYFGRNYNIIARDLNGVYPTYISEFTLDPQSPLAPLLKWRKRNAPLLDGRPVWGWAPDDTSAPTRRSIRAIFLMESRLQATLQRENVSFLLSFCLVVILSLFIFVTYLAFGHPFLLTNLYNLFSIVVSLLDSISVTHFVFIVLSSLHAILDFHSTFLLTNLQYLFSIVVSSLHTIVDYLSYLDLYSK